jgi:hypothetical protein
LTGFWTRTQTNREGAKSAKKKREGEQKVSFFTSVLRELRAFAVLFGCGCAALCSSVRSAPRMPPDFGELTG